MVQFVFVIGLICMSLDPVLVLTHTRHTAVCTAGSLCVLAVCLAEVRIGFVVGMPQYEVITLMLACTERTL